ncbi:MULTISPECIES: deoxyribose-phosphate aldolase [unclassified Prochlorococcus]|uniref:deoxyribose-phosphate aldolase n=1 Tax=unclassified Prochlorococcus TaxID=2627481 RepID=UPI000533AD47|nr:MULTISPECIES: deoxyribose-phosphate aldolase [unclassified Prochlorococcus]KGG16565.1 Deoxyribose-phosphate aldolase [Prochlorococcus sp. MIT 0602]KGG16960.1 Deoxyribose-phosphate aldolase [Prochlorococcus sp. MIT 0603]
MNNKSIKSSDNDISSFIHQAALDPHLDLDSLNQICDACNHFDFAGLCTNLIRLEAARKRLGNNKKTKLIAVIDFPFGYSPLSIKKTEAEWAAEYGAEELDMVPNFLKLSKGESDNFAQEVAEITSTGLPVRVILDSMRLPKESLELAIEACIDAGARGIQTGNGFGKAVTQDHILELHDLIKNRCEIKAAGGIKNLFQTCDLINAGATSIGTSFGTEIAKEAKPKRKPYDS